MSVMLVSVIEGKAHLNMDHDEDDELIEIYIQAASAAVLNYLGQERYNFIDSSTEDYFSDTSITADTTDRGNIPPEVRAATLLMLGELYKNREPNASDPVDPQYGYGYLPRAVVALLYPLRDPVIA